MKKLLPLADLLAAVLGIVGIVLCCTLGAVTYTLTSSILGGSTSSTLDPGVGIWGSAEENASSPVVVGAVIGLVLGGLGVIAAIFSLILSLNKKKAMGAALLGVFAFLCLVAAGVLVFCEVPMYKSAAGDASIDLGDAAKGTYSLTGGWIGAGICYCLGGAATLIPSIAVAAGKK
jgi:hypothetical protein